MSANRRDFLGRLAAGASLAAAGVGLDPRRLRAEPGPRPVSDKFDMTWRDRVRGQFRAAFDSPKADEGGEIWRAAIWRNQIAEVYGVNDDEITPVLVIRHAGIPLVMDDAFWARHNIGKKRKIKDPFTGKTARANPISSFQGKPNVSADMMDTALDGFIRRGGLVLACNFAFGLMVHLESQADKEHAKEARARALTHLVPGVVLQPSGFFALLEAQRAGCHLFAAGE